MSKILFLFFGTLNFLQTQPIIMRNLILLFAFLPITLIAQVEFKPAEQDRLTILVTDGTDSGRDSKIQPKGANDKTKDKMIPKSYDMVEGRTQMVFADPIKPLGMDDAIQAAAFLERPEYGRAGFMLIFSVNDSIGGKQGTYVANGVEYNGVYRLIRTKYTSQEPIPPGMAAYRIMGTIFILGVS